MLMCPREPATEKNPNLIKEKAVKKKKKIESDPLCCNTPLTPKGGRAPWGPPGLPGSSRAPRAALPRALPARGLRGGDGPGAGGGSAASPPRLSSAEAARATRPVGREGPGPGSGQQAGPEPKGRRWGGRPARGCLARLPPGWASSCWTMKGTRDQDKALTSLRESKSTLFIACVVFW